MKKLPLYLYPFIVFSLLFLLSGLLQADSSQAISLAQLKARAKPSPTQPSKHDQPGKTLSLENMPKEEFEFEIMPGQSKVSFLGHSTGHSFKGLTSVIKGWIRGNLKNLENTASTVITIEAATLDTNHKDRDKKMRELMEVKQYPTITFTSQKVKILDQDIESFAWKLQISGTLHIHNVPREITTIVDCRLKDGKLFVSGQTPLLMSDYKMEPPSFAFVLRTKDNVEVEFSFVGENHALSNK